MNEQSNEEKYYRIINLLEEHIKASRGLVITVNDHLKTLNNTLKVISEKLDLIEDAIKSK